MPAEFEWHGETIKRSLMGDIDARLKRAGQEAVKLARQLAPVKTGQLRESISAEYDAGSHTLTIVASAPHAVFQEFGTSRNPPHPFLRPAIAQIPRFLGIPNGVEVSFPNVGGKYAGAYQGRSKQGGDIHKSVRSAHKNARTLINHGR